MPLGLEQRVDILETKADSLQQQIDAIVSAPTPAGAFQVNDNFTGVNGSRLGPASVLQIAVRSLVFVKFSSVNYHAGTGDVSLRLQKTGDVANNIQEFTATDTRENEQTEWAASPGEYTFRWAIDNAVDASVQSTAIVYVLPELP